MNACIWLQTSASIQPRSNLPKFGVSAYPRPRPLLSRVKQTTMRTGAPDGSRGSSAKGKACRPNRTSHPAKNAAQPNIHTLSHTNTKAMRSTSSEMLQAERRRTSTSATFCLLTFSVFFVFFCFFGRCAPRGGDPPMWEPLGARSRKIGSLKNSGMEKLKHWPH